MKDKLFINPYGVQIYQHPTGVFLSYALNGKEHIELSFVSDKDAIQCFNVSSLNHITGVSIVSQHSFL